MDDIAKKKNGVDPEIAAYIDHVLEVKLAGRTIKVGSAQEDAGDAKDSAVKDDIEKNVLKYTGERVSAAAG